MCDKQGMLGICAVLPPLPRAIFRISVRCQFRNRNPDIFQKKILLVCCLFRHKGAQNLSERGFTVAEYDATRIQCMTVEENK